MEYKAPRESFRLDSMRPSRSWDDWARVTQDPALRELLRRGAERVVAILNMDEDIGGPQGVYTDDGHTLEQLRTLFRIATWRLRHLLVICSVETSPALARIGWRCSDTGAHIAPYAISIRSPYRKSSIKWIHLAMLSKPRPPHDDPYIERLKKAGIYIEGTITRLSASPRDALGGHWAPFRFGDGSTETVFVADPVPGQGRFIPLTGVAGAVSSPRNAQPDGVW